MIFLGIAIIVLVYVLFANNVFFISSLNCQPLHLQNLLTILTGAAIPPVALLAEVKSSNLVDCAVACGSLQKCKFIAYNDISHQCSLLNESSTSSVSFSEIYLTEKLYSVQCLQLYPCLNNPCGNNGVCSISGNLSTYQCNCNQTNYIGPNCLTGKNIQIIVFLIYSLRD